MEKYESLWKYEEEMLPQFHSSESATLPIVESS